MPLPEINMNAFCEGDEREYAKVFNWLYSPVVYFASQILDDRYDAEDVVVKVFEKLWIRRNKFEDTNKIKAFLYLSVKNACFNHIRAIKVRRVSHAEILHLSEHKHEDFVFGAMVKSELLMNIYVRIQHLSPRQREILKLKYVQDKSNIEIADMLHVSVSTVKTQQARALLYMRKDLV